MLERDPASEPLTIEARSFALIDECLPPPRKYSGDLWQVARRCIHTVGDPTIIDDLVLSEAALESGLAALAKGTTIITDTAMAREGITKRWTKGRSVRLFALSERASEADAKRMASTRLAAAIHSVAQELGGAILAIGNAPTALFALLDALDAGAPCPALIIGMPVGFVNAAQSKEALAKSRYPHFTLLGTRGGSALAAACVNALFSILTSREEEML